MIRRDQVSNLAGRNVRATAVGGRSGLISIIVTTYDRPDALGAVLRSLARQTDVDFEVIVADDGSQPETASVVADWKERLDHRFAHVWRPHEGFRAAQIRNYAIRLASGDYCIFLDGDCLARPNFVAIHRALAEQGWCVTGNRVQLSPELSQRVLRERLTPERWSVLDWQIARLGGRINRLAPLYSVPLGPLRKIYPRAWRGAQSCNLAVWRSDLVAVDGFDSDFNGWGREDSDLLVRLIRAGVRRKDGRMATGVLHLWHPKADRSHLPKNDRLLDETLASNRIQAKQGLSTLGERTQDVGRVSINRRAHAG